MPGQHNQSAAGPFVGLRLARSNSEPAAKPSPDEALLESMRVRFGPERGSRIFQLVLHEFGDEVEGRRAS